MAGACLGVDDFARGHCGQAVAVKDHTSALCDDVLDASIGECGF